MRTSRFPSKWSFAGPRRQRGAALYVALIMLILMALIGIVGMQVAGLQERMAANFLNVNLAFQNAEAGARVTERAIDTALSSPTGTYAANQEACETSFDPVTWADGVVDADSEGTSYTRRIDRCTPGGGSNNEGGPLNDDTDNTYEVTTLAASHDDNAASSAVVSTVYIP